MKNSTNTVKTYNADTITIALEEIGVQKGDTIFCHSNIGFFGRPEGEKSLENACKKVLDGIFQMLGENGTLIVPTFTYSFPNNQIFNPEKTDSNCGSFSEYIRKLDKSHRTLDPNVSVAVIGKRTSELTENLPSNTYHSDGIFGRFRQLGGKLCNLNFDAGSTYLHYVERELAVPYRFDKTFTGQIQTSGTIQDSEATIWVRKDLIEKTIAQFETFTQVALDLGKFKTSKVGRGSIGMITTEDSFQIFQDEIKTNPMFLTKACKRRKA